MMASLISEALIAPSINTNTSTALAVEINVITASLLS